MDLVGYDILLIFMLTKFYYLLPQHYILTA
jgi:hypothetical protein